MLVSIVVPVYNVAEFLPNCLNCVINQTWQDLQIILVDDGSTDDSGSICDQYAEKDKRIEVIHQNNEGLSVARNEGTKRVRGEYLLYLDSDDTWGSLDFVEKLVQQAEDNHPDIILFEVRDFRHENEKVSPIGAYTSDIMKGSPTEIMIRLMRAQLFSMSACQKFIRTDIIKRNKIQFTPQLLGEDMDWIMSLWPYVQSVEGNTEVCYRYRIRKNSITQTYGYKNAADFCWIIEKWLKNWEQTNSYEKNAYLGYLAFLYVTLVYKFFFLQKKDRIIIKNRILDLAEVLKYSITKKSNRLKITKQLFGKKIMLYFWGGIQYVRKRHRRI